MRIALVHMRYSWTGGTERYLSQLCTHLLERGHDVTVVCRTMRGDADPRLKFVVLKPFSIGAGWRMWAFAQAVEEHVRREKYDVVYGLGKTWTHDAIRLGGGCHKTYLEMARGPTLSSLDRIRFKGLIKHPLALRIEERALSGDSLRHVITNSEMVKRDAVARYGVPADNVSVIYNGVDIERFDRERHAEAGAALRSELGFTEDEIVVLFLGSGYGRKGLTTLLEAFPQVAEKAPEARLVVAGFERRQAHFEALAQSLGIEEQTRFLGGRSDTNAVYAASDLYVLPTLYDPFANTTLEALASGLPVITTESNGGSELIESGVHGTTLSTPPSSSALAEAILAWSDPAKLQAARETTRQLAEQFTADLTARRSADVLEEIAASR